MTYSESGLSIFGLGALGYQALEPVAHSNLNSP